MKAWLRQNQNHDSVAQDWWKQRGEDFEEIQRSVQIKLLMLSIEEVVDFFGNSHNEYSNYVFIIVVQEEQKNY